jgi:NAD(P) transhydrogenase subunit alpha
MKIGIPRETVAGERRVAIIPETIKRLVAKKLEVVVEAGAGTGANVADAEYTAVGATLAPTAADLWGGVDAVVKVQVPTEAEIGLLREGSTIISLLYPLSNLPTVKALAARKANVLANDLIPRTTLAQMMDVLSSQATLAGYRAVVLAAEALPKLFPMLMTAAGTIAPARILILGAGVAGLQAIATARRLGAVVEAFDVRKVVKEQVESLGAKFIEVPVEEDAQTAGGYAKEVSEEYKKKQGELLEQRLAACDACVTTALIPGKRAPILVTEKMVRLMKSGSVVVDLAAEQGGNCELTKPGETIKTPGRDGMVTVVGERNLPSQMSVHASQMYSRNMEKLIGHLLKDGALNLDSPDEITRGVVIVRNGDVVHAGVKEALSKG